MTHPTDEELDALQAKLRNGDQMDGKTVNCKHDQCNCALLCDADDAITTLRTQLAVAQEELSRRVDMHECAMAERDDATLYGVEQKARADRAEAALAAQNEADAWHSIETAPRDGTWFIARTRLGTTRVVHYADRSDRYPIAHDDKAWPTAPMEWMPISIRNQPHDRTALDRMLAEAREQALRDAADEMEDERAKQAILALIEKP